MKSTTETPIYGCPWYEHRFNVVPFGIIGHRMPAQFPDDLDSARAVKSQMVAAGAEDVRIYDTVGGEFFE